MSKHGGIIVIIGAFVFSMAILLGSIGYETMWKVETVDTALSEDAAYEVVLQSVGEPIWPYGPAPGRLVLKKDNQTVSVTRFEISNDGGSFGKGAWKVTWHSDRVEIILSGEEQPDEQFTLFFDGETESIGLTTKHGKEIEYPAENVTEKSEDQEEELSIEEQRIVDGYQAIYQELSGKLSENAAIYYGAKADSTRCVLFEDERRADYLVYDRESENGNCGLYVRYQCEKAADGAYDFAGGTVIDIYAYVYEDGDVISSGKTGWSDAGSKEYQTITGE